MNKTINELTALIRSTKRSVDGELSDYLDNLLQLGNELTSFAILLEETMRQLSEITTFEKLEPLALHQVVKLVRKLNEFPPMFDGSRPARQIWEDLPELKRQIFFFCATELCKFLRVINSGGTWRGVNKKVAHGKEQKNVGLDQLEVIYSYFESEAESIKMADIKLQRVT